MRTDNSLASEHEPDASQRRTPLRRAPTVAVKATYVELLRDAAGWTNADLARRSGLDQSAIARLLRRELRPGTRVIAGLLAAFAGPERVEADGTVFPAGPFPDITFAHLFDLVDSRNRPIVMPGVGDTPAPVKAAS